MNIEHVEAGAGVVLVVSGQVDMHTSPVLRQHLLRALKAQKSPVVADLTEVSFIDSSGLATFIEALKGAGRYGGALRLVGLAPAVKNLFQLSKLTSIFDIRDTREDALGTS